jgi:SPP1 family predicted phage head-tail adaptor
MEAMKITKKNTITAGDLKDRLTLLIPTVVSNGRGGSTITYSDYATVWCKAQPYRNSRTLQEAQLIFNDSFNFIIRYSEVPITAAWMIRFNGADYTIHTIDDVENRYQYYSILAYTKKL